MLMTLAPWSAAQIIPLSTAEQVVVPVLLKIFTGRMSLSQATPVTPIELLLEAAAAPATPVPRFILSLLSVESIMLAPASSFGARSGIGDTHQATIAMKKLGLPLVLYQDAAAS